MDKQSVTEFHKSCAIIYNGIPGEQRQVAPMLNIVEDSTPAGIISVLDIMGHLKGVEDKTSECLVKNDKLLDTMLVLRSYMRGALDFEKSDIEREVLATEFLREINKVFPGSWELL